MATGKVSLPFFGCLLSRIKENGREPAKSRECFIHQYHPAGEECQFDWGDVKLKIHGRRLTVRMTVFTLPHSNHRTAYLFLRENTLAFMESHRNYFHDIGRIPKRMVYDDIVEAYNSLKESHVHNATLQLMEDKLQPGNAQKAISLTSIQQDGKSIEENTENGLCAVAQLTNNPTNTTGYAAGR